MKAKYRFMLGNACALTAIAIAMPAQAQSVDSATTHAVEKENATLDEIVVTAQRRSESLQNVPISVSAIDGKGLEARGVHSLDSVGNFVPNLSLQSTAAISGSSNASTIFIRGVGQSDFLLVSDPGVGVYVDGVYFSRSPGGVLDLVDLDRVEVLRGPQGTLFGRNTIGGAINISSKLPGDKFEGRLQGTFGSFDRIDVSGTVNIPISDRFAVRLTGASNNRDGYVTRLVDGQKLGNKNSDTVRATARIDLTDDVRIMLAGDYTVAREQSTPQVLRGIDPALPPGPVQQGLLAFLYNANVAPVLPVPGFGVNTLYDTRWVTGNPDTTWQTGVNRSDLDVWGLSGTIESKLGDLTLKSITAYRELKAVFGGDHDGSPLQLSETFDRYRHHQFSQELQIGGKSFDDKLTWIAGAYFYSEKGSDQFDIALAPSLSPALVQLLGVEPSNIGTMRIDNKSYALFTQGTYQLTPEFSATLGVRYTREEKGFSTDQRGSFSNIPYLTNPNSNQTFENLSPKLGVEYRFDSNVMAYASVSRGFKSGGVNGRYTSPQAEPLTFKPEKLTAYEIGFKSELFNRRLRFNAAAFYSDYSDIQVTVQVGSTPFNQNAAKAKIKGLELEMTAVPLDGLTLTAGLGYLDARIAAVSPNSLVAVGNRLVDTPDWSINGAAEYRVPLGSGSLTGRLDWAYRSTAAKDAVNSPLLIQSGYAVGNARLTYTAADVRWSLAGFVTNLTDQRYVTNGMADLPSFGFTSVIYSRPREWGVTLATRF